jgi:hypothetical protein
MNRLGSEQHRQDTVERSVELAMDLLIETSNDFTREAAIAMVKDAQAEFIRRTREFLLELYVS